MGITHHAIVEVYWPKSQYGRAHWEDVSTWDFGKVYALRHALTDADQQWRMTGKGKRILQDDWPASTRRWNDHSDPERTSARLLVDEGDVAFGRCWIDAQDFIAFVKDYVALTALAGTKDDDGDEYPPLTSNMLALAAALGTLVESHEKVRVLFYCL